MRLQLVSLLLVPAALALPIAPAVAQSVGMQVTDTNGGQVGTVTAIKDDLVTVKTDRHEVALPKASFTVHEGKLLFGMTQAALNAATDQSLAEAAAALQSGASVKGAGGVTVGTIESIDAEYATIKLAGGALVRIPRSGIAAGSDGAVIGLTLEQLTGQVGAADAGGAADTDGQ